MVPASLVPELLQQLHGGPASAQFLAERVWEKARQSYYWPFMLRDIRQWCDQCRACQTRRCPVPGQRAPMGRSQVSRPMQRVAVDILELPLTSLGNLGCGGLLHKVCCSVRTTKPDSSHSGLFEDCVLMRCFSTFFEPWHIFYIGKILGHTTNQNDTK